MVETSEILNLEGAASYLKLNDQTVRRFAREGTIPAFRIGASWRFKRSVLDAWAETGQTGHGAILVVDDEQPVRDLLDDMLSRAGHRVQTAREGDEALALMRENMPDLVILDLKMPGLDGPTTLGAIRSIWDQFPVIILTGYPESDLMDRALEHSPVLLMRKPVERHRLLSAVRFCLGVPKTTAV